MWDSVSAWRSNPDKALRSSLQPGEALSRRRLHLKQPGTVCQTPGRAQIKLSITGRVYGNYMFVNMLEKCALGSSSVRSGKQFCSEITFQMDEGDPHQIANTLGILIPPVAGEERRPKEKRGTTDNQGGGRRLIPSFCLLSHLASSWTLLPFVTVNDAETCNLSLVQKKQNKTKNNSFPAKTAILKSCYAV